MSVAGYSCIYSEASGKMAYESMVMYFTSAKDGIVVQSNNAASMTADKAFFTCLFLPYLHSIASLLPECFL